MKISSALLGFIVTPLLLFHLGEHNFGIYVLLTSLMPWLALADLGFVPALRIHLARALGHSSSDSETTGQDSIAVAWYGQGILLVVMLAVGLLAAKPVAVFFGIEHAAAVPLIRLLVVAFVVVKFGQIFGAVLSAHQRIDIEQAGRALQAGLRAALIVAILLLGGGLVGVAAAWVAAALAAVGWLAVRARPLLPPGALAVRNLNIRGIGPMLGTGLWLSLGATAGLFIAGADRAIVARLISLEAVARFSITASLYVLAETLLNHFVDSGRPLLARRRGEGDIAGSTQLYLALSRTTKNLGWIAALTVLAVNQSFITIWVGAEHYGGLLLDGFFALNLVVQSALIPERAALSSALMVRPGTLSRTAEGVINVALSVVLAGTLGAAGVAAATSLAAVVTSSWYLPMVARRVYPGGARVVGSPLGVAAAAMVAVAFRMIAPGLNPWGMIALVASVGGAAAVWLLSTRSSTGSQLRYCFSGGAG